MTKPKLKKQIYSFTAVFEPAEEGGYVVHVPALPGCRTQGETFEEAQTMARDAIEGYLEILRSRKEEIPVEPEGVVVSKVGATLS